MKMEHVLYYNRTAILRDLACNDGIDMVLENLEEFRRQGIDVQVVDTTRMSEQELQSAYIPAIMPSVSKKYRVRRIFGSNRHAGSMFGRGVPVLVIRDPSGKTVGDVFPHEQSGQVITIRDALTRLNPSVS
jgi:hypothetical protein